MADYKKGDIISIAGHCGIVRAVYCCDDKPPILRVDFVKNAIRQIGTELVDTGVLPEHAIKTATLDDLIIEFQELQRHQYEYVDKMIEER